MKYLLLLHGDPDAEAALSDDERRAIREAHGRFAGLLVERNAMVSGEALLGPSQARTAQFAEDGTATTVTDGPYLETKEALGGFYVLECPTLDEAIELTKELPRSPGLVAELLPIAGM
jgi:hypothetical protein